MKYLRQRDTSVGSLLLVRGTYYHRDFLASRRSRGANHLDRFLSSSPPPVVPPPAPPRFLPRAESSARSLVSCSPAVLQHGNSTTVMNSHYSCTVVLILLLLCCIYHRRYFHYRKKGVALVAIGVSDMGNPISDFLFIFFYPPATTALAVGSPGQRM